MRNPGNRHPRGAGAGGRLPPAGPAERDRFGMTGRGYEEFGRDDFDRKGVGAERGYETVGQRDRVDLDPRSQRQGRFGDYDDYGDEYGAPSPMRPYYETEFSGGFRGPEDEAMRGHGSYPGGEPSQRGGTDAVDYDRGYTSERRGPYADYRDYQTRPERGLYRGQGGSVEDAYARRRGEEAPDYRGVGPRNYRRTDARIAEDVNDRLTDDPHVDASEISVSVEGGEVTLDGRVASRTMKRRAEDLADTVAGVVHVQNNLRAQRRAEGGDVTFGNASGPSEPGGSGREAPDEPATGPRTGQKIGDTGTGETSGRTTRGE